MAFTPVLVDGFDNYTVGDQRWTVGQTFTCHPDFSRHAWGQGASFIGAFPNVPNTGMEIPPLTTTIVEGAFKLIGKNANILDSFHWSKMDVETYRHVAMTLTDTRHVFFRRGDNQAILAGPTVGPDKVIEVGLWYWLQFTVKIHASLGEIHFGVNGNTWLSATGLNTLHPSASSAVTDRFGVAQFATDAWIADDVVIQNGATGEYQGDMIVLGKRPAAAGSSADLTPVGAATAHEATDEIAADDDTTYVASSTVGERDSMEIAKITEVPGSSIVLAVQQSFRHRKDEPGPRSVTGFVRVASDEVHGEERFPSETAYLTSIEAPMILQPDGVSAWGTVDEFNALDVEIGHEVQDGVE